MARKDVLASGQRSAKFAGGVGENDIFRNVSKEAKDDSVPEVTPVKVVRKKFIPNEGILLIRPIETAAGSTVIITEQIEKERPSEGTVVEVGPNPGHTVGSHVVYGKYSGTEFKINGETLLLMEQKDILGRVIDEPQEDSVEIEVVFPVSIYHDGDCGR